MGGRNRGVEQRAGDHVELECRLGDVLFTAADQPADLVDDPECTDQRQEHDSDGGPKIDDPRREPSTARVDDGVGQERSDQRQDGVEHVDEHRAQADVRADVERGGDGAGRVDRGEAHHPVDGRIATPTR